MHKATGQSPWTQSPTGEAGASIAFLGREEFLRCQRFLSGFDAFGSYRDFVDEMEGLQIGLGAAGVEAAPVPLLGRSFLSWCRNYGHPPSSERLNEFAEQLAAHRMSQLDTLEVLTVDDPTVARANASRGFGRWVLEIRRDHYDAWLRCRGLGASQETANAYGRLLVRHWRAAADGASRRMAPA